MGESRLVLEKMRRLKRRSAPKWNKERGDLGARPHPAKPPTAIERNSLGNFLLLEWNKGRFNPKWSVKRGSVIPVALALESWRIHK